eukprot:CAMPEP_0204592916 /NCGR_PEP_ID=MMETSP0661-20131031/51203_1 /ASSEMBLY_ACC=CAM_ASM_000606 /TAXON_ID=109239 /ORGANISM="Alexandrium margalefi, Strain AMGDE01CS-322" /LENGTH=165 /DNA_ID=CAMNT_0051603171 /DNA_START=58 /DNA_END=555 /DNA_ORIENTATION=-
MTNLHLALTCVVISFLTGSASIVADNPSYVRREKPDEKASMIVDSAGVTTNRGDVQDQQDFGEDLHAPDEQDVLAQPDDELDAAADPDDPTGDTTGKKGAKKKTPAKKSPAKKAPAKKKTGKKGRAKKAAAKKTPGKKKSGKKGAKKKGAKKKPAKTDGDDGIMD